MTLNIGSKLPTEVIPGYYVDFSNVLLDDEVITEAGVSSSVDDMIETDSVMWEGQTVSWTTVGGTSNTKPIFTVSVTGDKGSFRKAQVSIKVLKEI